ncbi:MAG TPA: cyanophycin synthetase [Solirubrobacteraceae bacterium]|nr:cyanophycin synthetase [Solirubrobacteraceae bacterium]
MPAVPAAAGWSAEDAERYLLSLELFGMRFGLERMRRLMTVLGHPERRFETIHVVGTNGKSSTARMIAALLRRDGAHVGVYLSPHLLSFAERIRVDERDLSDAEFANAVARAAHASSIVDRASKSDDRVTQFEALTAAALDELARQKVEVAVVEAGLGGRHDATSVVHSQVQVLTNVDLEHQRWLGPTLRDIALEKLAVTQPGGTLVVGDLDPSILAEARATATSRGARLVQAPEDAGVELAALGAFQRRNFALALSAARALRPALGDTAARAAAGEVVVPGRLQLVGHDPLTFLDGAHNPAGVAALAESLPELLGARPLAAVVSVLDDKDAAAMLRVLLGLSVHVVACACSNPRALPPATLQSLALQLGGPAGGGRCEIELDPRRALALAGSLVGDRGAVLATGSIYLVADLLRKPGARRASTL